MRFQDEAQLLQLLQGAVESQGHRLDASRPMANARLPDGSRVNVVARPISTIGPVAVIRKFPQGR